MDIVNTKLLAHPVNWVLIWVLLTFAGLGLAIVSQGLAGLPFPAKA